MTVRLKQSTCELTPFLRKTKFVTKLSIFQKLGSNVNDILLCNVFESFDNTRKYYVRIFCLGMDLQYFSCDHNIFIHIIEWLWKCKTVENRAIMNRTNIVNHF